MQPPDRCPECGSREVSVESRRVIPEGLIEIAVCPICDWVSDRRVGRRPADRSKNFALRQRLASQREQRDPPSDPP